MVGGRTFAQEAEISDEENFTGVRVRNTEIKGRVFVVGEREDAEEYPAEDVRVQVRDYEDDEEVLAETVTDEEGSYDLPRFDVGTYWLHIGRLRLEMRVVSEPAELRELPKVIIVMIPEDLAR